MPVAELVIVEGMVLHIEDERAYEWNLKRRLPAGVAYHRVSILGEAGDLIGYKEIKGFIVDLWIHGQNSAGLIRRIRRERPEAPLVVLTKYSEDPALKELVSEGAVEAGDIFDKTQIEGDALENLINHFQPGAPPRAVPLPPGMDLRLLHLVEKARRGLLSRATASTRPGEIPVMARVNDLESWKILSGLRAGVEIPRPGGKEWIVTGRLQAEQAEFVHRQPFVLSLEAGQLLAPQLESTLKEVRAEAVADLLRDPEAGKGVVMGFVDNGCDFVHPNFRHDVGMGGTRILSLWHQDAENHKGPVDYGALYESSDLDAELAAADPYQDYPVSPGAHGTHVMDIAAGSGAGTGVSGVAPAADLVFVDLSVQGVPWGEGALELTESVHLLEAITHVFEQAGDRPCVLNLSIGTELGAHDGTSTVEIALDDLVSAAPNRAVVVAASNSYELGVHASGVVLPESHVELPFQVEEGHCVVLDLWYGGQDRFAVETFSPTGQGFGRVELGISRRWPDPNGEFSMKLTHVAQHPNNRDNRIWLFLKAGSPGVWKLRLYGIDVQDGRFHAWIEGDGGTTPHFFLSPDPTHTLGCLACGHESIAVGAYNVYDDLKPCSFSSAGPTRDGRQKPDLSAPGERVLAARSRSLNEAIAYGGTSMATPVVAGIVAVLLAEAEGLGIRLEGHEIREILRRAARLDPPEQVWHLRYGWGRVDARGAILAFRERNSAADGMRSPESGP